VFGKVGFDPGVRVAGADDVITAHVVELAGQKASGIARGNSQRAQHDGHGRSEVLAMSGTAYEKEVGQRIGGGRAGEVEGVTEARLKVALDSVGLVVFVVRAGGDLLGELRDARVELRQLKIQRANDLRIGRGGRAQFRRRHDGK